MRRRHDISLSEGRHRKYKRKMRNLFIETIFIAILIFVAIRINKKDEIVKDKTDISSEEQIKIINEEMEGTKPKTEIKSLEIPVVEQQGIVIIGANLSYIDEQTIISFEVKNYNLEYAEKQIPINLVDRHGKIVEEADLYVEILEKDQQMKMNMAFNGDLRDVTKIQIRDDNEE